MKLASLLRSVILQAIVLTAGATGVLAQSIEVTSPAEGDTWNPGETYTIAWTGGEGVGNVKIAVVQGDAELTVLEASVENTGSYEWTIPADAPTPVADLQIAVSGAGDGTPVGLSGVFSIDVPQPKLTVKSPTSASDYYSGDRVTISWATEGDIPSVGVYSSFDNGASFDEIDYGVTNHGLYMWTTNLEMSGECLIMVANLDGTVSDTSEAFVISPAEISIVTPAEGQVVQAGTNLTLEWSSKGGISSVKIELSTDGGDYTTLFPFTPNDGSEEWTVPMEPAENCKIRITEYSKGTPVAESGVFSISTEAPTKAISVTIPDTRTEWTGGESGEITWETSGDISAVRIEYTTDGSAWQEEIASTPNTGSYSWTVPSISTTTARVRVSDASDASVIDVSEEFTIVEPVVDALEITAPSGGEAIVQGTEFTATWTSTGDIAAVAIDYSHDNGTTWNTIIGSVDNTGTYTWTVPEEASTQALLRISDAADSDPASTSEAFSIVAPPDPTITISQPAGGAVLETGSSETVTWSITQTVGDVELLFSSDGTAWTVIDTVVENTMEYTWAVGTEAADPAYLMVREAVDAAPSDTVTLVIAEPAPETIEILSPTAETEVTAGGIATITWEASANIENVSIKYTFDGAAWLSITEETPNDGSHDWEIPHDAFGQAGIRIADASDDDPTDVSEAFTITEPQVEETITISSPQADAVLTGGGSHEITWSSTGEITRVNIEISLDDETWHSIVDSLENSAPYAWTVPDTSVNAATIRISDVDGSPVATSQPFAIAAKPALMVTEPAEGDIVYFGQKDTIRWTTRGSVENVKIEGTLDGTSWQTIVESMANTGEFAWTAPSTAVEGLTLRISDAADGEPFGLSGAFSVVKPPTITIKRFGGWEVAEAGSADSIIWTSTGNIDSVKIELTMDQENWTVITESTPNTGRYDWDVPDTTALTCKIRISDAVNGSPSAESKLTFSIQHKTRVLVPVVSGMVGNGFTTQAGILRARFGLAKDASASLRIFAANGRLIATPLARVLPAGYHTIEWNLNEYSRGAAGVYFAELTIDGKSFRRRFFARR